MLQKWWFKCAAQQLLSHIPYGRRINGLWRRGDLSFDSHALHQAVYHVQLLRQAGFDLNGKVALEFGSGWTPILPYVFRMAGCKTVILCDLYRHMTLDLLQLTLRHLRERAPYIADGLEIDVEAVERGLPETKGSFTSLLNESRFEYCAPYDVRHTTFPDHSIDLVTSRAVLEHIPRRDLQAIMKEMRRIIQPGGAMVHTIDHSDHWQHFDRRISRINFLKFSRSWWRLINSDISYQNRLRSSEHLQLIRDAGFHLKCVEGPVDRDALTDAHRPWIHADYRAFRREDLAVLTTYLVAQPN